jgi:hypothetical protein
MSAKIHRQNTARAVLDWQLRISIGRISMAKMILRTGNR